MTELEKIEKEIERCESELEMIESKIKFWDRVIICSLIVGAIAIIFL